jgi:tetratricopeptide (TPR) repeat protein
MPLLARITRLTAAAALLALAAAPAARAQRPAVHDVPPRPTLFAAADTNSANAYYLHGVQRLESAPREAAAAFYWAERLNPGWADALFARHVALLLAEPFRLIDYMSGRSYELRKADVVAMDSLVLRATQRDPFLNSPLEKTLWMTYFRTYFRDAARRAGVDPTLEESWLQESIFHADPSFRAWLDFVSGRYAPAADGYRRQSTELRLQLGRAQYLAGEYAPAAATLAEAISRYQADDQRDVVHLYQSKAVLEYSRAAALERMGDTAAANQAYARTLEEDLSFWAAHRRLAQKAAEKGDEATALAEMALTVELAPGEADLRYEHAALLMLANQVDPAVAELHKAIELDPFYATPHYLLALLNDGSQVVPVAIDHYRHFLSLAARDDARRANAQARLAALEAPAPAAAPAP